MRCRGQSVIEYSLLVVSVAILILGGALAFGARLRIWFDYLVSHVINGY